MGASRSKMKVTLRITVATLQLLLNIIIYTIVLMALIKYSAVAYDFAYQIFGKVTVAQDSGKDYKVQIKEGESTKTIAAKLELNKVIVNQYSFWIKVKLTNTVIMSGEYILNSSMDYDEILKILSAVDSSQ